MVVVEAWRRRVTAAADGVVVPGGTGQVILDLDGGGADGRAPIAQALGNQMYLAEIDDALTRARAATGIDRKFSRARANSP